MAMAVPVTKLELFPAGAPELVRSNQKDLHYHGYLTSLLADMTEPLLPRRYWLAYQRELQLAAELIYYSITTLSGNQTLGEEYCNIIQVNQSAVPSSKRRIASVLIHVIGRYLIERGAGLIRDCTSNDKLAHVMGSIEEIMKISNQVHLSIFYIFGVYQWLSKRLTGIRYLMIRYTSIQQPPNPYRLLGIIIAIQVAIRAFKWIKNRLWGSDEIRIKETSDTSHDDNTRNVSSSKCSLCLECCISPTVPPCGHLYCWKCIIEWVSERGTCPVCRNPTEPRQCVALQNFQ